MKILDCSSFSVSIPEDWSNIIEYEVNNAPLTLAKRNGVGALQFSLAHYRSGAAPEPTLQDLEDLVYDFGNRHGLGKPYSIFREMGALSLVAANFDHGSDIIRAWYVSDTLNFALVTYICEARLLDPHELHEAEVIVRTLTWADFKQNQ